MALQNAKKLDFMKMHGLGNDFVIVDTRASDLRVNSDIARQIGHRHFGVGFDQLAVISDGTWGDLDLTFYNADGSTAGACGNATRCVAQYEMDRLGRDTLTLATERGQLVAERAGDMVAVNMGQPLLTWDQVPLAREMDTLELPIKGGPTATGMGNPHCSFFVPDANAVDLERFGPEMEHHPLFPKRTNVQVAHLIGPDHLRMRVWERGAGITLASGSSSCAVAVAAHRRGITGRKVTLDLDGGQIFIDWRDDGVWMTGPTVHVFNGSFTPDFLAHS